MSTGAKHILFIFIPAIFLVLCGLVYQIIRYAPTDPTALLLNPKNTDAPSVVPIFTDDAIIGQKNAAETVIVFADIACSHCQDDLQFFQTLTTQYPKKVKIIWKGLSVVRIPYPSDEANAYAYCAGIQNQLLSFGQALVNENNDTLTTDVLKHALQSVSLDIGAFNTCVASSAPKDYASRVQSLAHDLNIQDTPTIFFHNKQIEAPNSLDGWKTLLGI